MGSRRRRLGPITSEILSPQPRRPQFVEAQAAHHHDEPAANIVDAVEVDAQEATEGVLNDVLGAAEVAKHLEGEIDQKRSMLTPHLVDGRVRSISVAARSAAHSGLLALVTTSKDE